MRLKACDLIDCSTAAGYATYLLTESQGFNPTIDGLLFHVHCDVSGVVFLQEVR